VTNLAAAKNVQQLLQVAAAKRIFTSDEAAQRWGEPLRTQLQQLPWSVIEEVAHRAYQQAGCRSPGVRELLLLMEIVQRESKHQLSGAEATTKLLATAVQLQDACAVSFLCKQEAATRMIAASFVSLLQAVIAQQQWQLSKRQVQVQQLHKRRRQQLQQRQQQWQQEQLKALQAVLSLPAAAVLVESPELAQQVLQQAMKQQLPQPLMLLLVDKLRSCCACM
jgi:hypothetical protein